MSRVMVVALCLSLSAVSSPLAVAQQNQESITLNVALYPYVPLRRDLFFELEQAFENKYPGINVQLVEEKNLHFYYYSGGLVKVNADIYEIDTILLSDMISAGKIGPIDLPYDDFTEAALESVTRNGKVYAVPHWICGNFLFYRKGDLAIQNAKSWQELIGVFEKRQQTIFVDLKGKSTLGEWYLTLLASKIGLDRAQKEVIASTELDTDVIDLLGRVLENCPAGYCRNDMLHDRTGYYARAFVRGQAAAYVGYSETLHYGLQYVLENCDATSGCLTEREVAVRKLPSIDQNRYNEGLGWVDGLALDKGLAGRKRKMAKAFIDFLVSDEAYRLVLEPEWGEAPKYLLPARRVKIGNAPIYPELFASHAGRRTGTVQGLNGQLRKIGKKLDCTLPFERTELEQQASCAVD